MNSATFPVMGIPVVVTSNCARVMTIAERAFGAWRALESTPHVIENGAAHVEITVEAEASHTEMPALEFDVNGLDRLEIWCGASHGVADSRTQQATAVVRESLLRHEDQFRHNFLETLALYLVSPRDRQPLHAAAVVDGDAALLLAGPPGVGKSTLMYACIKAGLRVLADDHVNLQLHPTLRIWGMPSFVHVRPEARAFFPELPGTAGVVANGARKIPIALNDLDARARMLYVERAALCLLQRNGEAFRVETLYAEEALQGVTSSLASGFALYTKTIAEPLSRIVTDGAWRMTLGDNPARAVPEITRLLELVRKGSHV